LQRVEGGEAKEKIDEAARAFGMPMGPIELADTVGLDVIAHVGKIMGLAAAGNKLDAMVSAGKLGKKSGEGFYVWKDGKPDKAEPTAPYDRFEMERLGRELVDPLIREAERVRDEKIVASADLVDAGIIFGTGFAPFRGGPLHFKANEQKSNVEVLRRTAAE
jgi:3-hydroxyacyl-CoA dehydrogenase/enoyl-CoA hydratase/3-hydroxybutyryl-CoA epimerase